MKISEHSPAAAAQRAQETKLETKQEAKQEAKPALVAANPSMAAMTTLLPAAVGQKAVAKATYEELVQHMEPAIQAQMAEVQAVLDSKGLKGGDVASIFNIDITGHDVMVCLACGVIGHDYQPTLTRQANPELNMLSETLVVYMEVAERLGMPFGVVAYDEVVLPLKTVGKGSTAAERAELIRRFETFVNRHDIKVIKDGVIMKWMEEEAKKYNPAEALKARTGEPNDKGAIDVAKKLHSSFGAGVKGVTIVKGQPAKTSMKTAEAVMASGGIALAGIAVGEKAAETAKAMPARTAQVPKMHSLRDNVGASLKTLVEKAKK